MPCVAKKRISNGRLTNLVAIKGNSSNIVPLSAINNAEDSVNVCIRSTSRHMGCCLVVRCASLILLLLTSLFLATVAAQEQLQKDGQLNSQSEVSSNTFQMGNGFHQQKQQQFHQILRNDSSLSDEESLTKFEMHKKESKETDKQKMSTVRLDMSDDPALLTSSRSVSMNRNNLLSGGNILQRQLREKAKQDSLESIKMHILMRLNLKKLPNITKPIAVPQKILENFYKTYNATLTDKAWRSSNINTSSPTTVTGAWQPSKTQSDKSLRDDDLSAEMQGDDANAYKWVDLNKAIDTTDDYDSILSHTNSIYVFPEQPYLHVRHSRKADLLRFKFDSKYSDLSYAKLHLYLRGWEWIDTHHPNLLRELNTLSEQQRDIDIVCGVHRAVRRSNSTSFTHKAKILEFRHKIPSGLGQWIMVDMKSFFTNRAFDDVFASNASQEILIKVTESWMKPLIVTIDNTAKSPLTVHIEIGSQKKHRRKRSIYMDCTESDQDVRCCRYPLKVNFTTFGWNFIVAPSIFDAYFCSGDCRVGYLEQYTHTHLTSLTASASPCCSPTKMSSLSLLYFDNHQNLVLSVIPNMSVEGCSCS